MGGYVHVRMRMNLLHPLLACFGLSLCTGEPAGAGSEELEPVALKDIGAACVDAGFEPIDVVKAHSRRPVRLESSTVDDLRECSPQDLRVEPSKRTRETGTKVADSTVAAVTCAYLPQCLFALRSPARTSLSFRNTFTLRSGGRFSFDCEVPRSRRKPIVVRVVPEGA